VIWVTRAIGDDYAPLPIAESPWLARDQAATGKAEYISRHGQLTDSRGRRLDLKQAAIVVTAQRNSLLDPALLGLVSATLGSEG
jgi:hypothetical protein